MSGDWVTMLLPGVGVHNGGLSKKCSLGSLLRVWVACLGVVKHFLRCSPAMEIFFMPLFKKILLTPLLSGLFITLHQPKEVAMSQRPEPIILGSVEKR